MAIFYENAKIAQGQGVSSMIHTQGAAVYSRRPFLDTVQISAQRSVSFWFELASPLAKS